MAEIVPFTGITTLAFDPDLILREAIGQLEDVIIIGTHKDGTEFFASSGAGGPDIVWQIERAKLNLLRMVDPAQ